MITSFKVIILFTSLLSVSFYSIAQQADSLLKANQIKLNAKLFGIGTSYERLLAERFTLFSEAGISSGSTSGVSRYSFNQGWKVYFVELYMDGRYYYNLKRRAQSNKRTANNSANFWSFSLNYGFKPFTSAQLTQTSEVYLNGEHIGNIEMPIKEYSSLTFGPNWGIQRMVGNRFSLETILGIGLNYLDDYKDWSVVPTLSFRFGYVMK